MSQVEEVVREIIADVCDIEEAEIGSDAHILSDLGVDSVDFLDVVHEIDRKYGITLPVEDWADAVNDGGSDRDYFVMSRFVANIEQMITTA